MHVSMSMKYNRYKVVGSTNSLLGNYANSIRYIWSKNIRILAVWSGNSLNTHNRSWNRLGLVSNSIQRNRELIRSQELKEISKRLK